MEEITLLNFARFADIAIIHARRAGGESRASERPLKPASYRGTRSALGEPRRSVPQRGALLHTNARAYFDSLRGNKYKSCDCIRVGVVGVMAPSLPLVATRP